jgi:hypothetical protein
MQDYPQHLLAARVIRSLHDPAFDFQQYYTTRLHVTYSLFYVVTVLLSWVVPIEIAGKLTVSLYAVLVTAVVVRLHRRHEAAGWGALLFYPLALNQQFFLGNVNFLLSLPLLIFALLDMQEFVQAEPGLWTFVRPLLWQVALVVAHPFTFDVYVGLALVLALYEHRRARHVMFKGAVWAVTAAALFISVWRDSQDAAIANGPSAVRWAPIADTVGFFLHMFNGMQPSGSADLVVVGAWVGILLVVGTALVTRPSALAAVRVHLVLLAVTLLAMVILPYQIGDYTFINLRVASISYFLLALAAATVPLAPWRNIALAVLLMTCMVDSSATQWKLSRELAEIAPLLANIPKNSRLLPLVFDRGSPELDRRMFNLNMHAYDYYYVAIGGGYDPYLPKGDLYPVHYAPDQERPAPWEFEPQKFTWERFGQDFDYFLVRGMPAGAEDYFTSGARLIGMSGPWQLFRR